MNTITNEHILVAVCLLAKLALMLWLAYLIGHDRGKRKGKIEGMTIDAQQRTDIFNAGLKSGYQDGFTNGRAEWRTAIIARLN